MVDMPYEDFIRTRITELRIAKDVSEHRMSLDLGKSGSYMQVLPFSRITRNCQICSAKKARLERPASASAR